MSLDVKPVPTDRHLDWLDYARLLAAISVMLYHFTYWGPTAGLMTSFTSYAGLDPVTRYGYLGVSFFFIISGFVIFSSAAEKPADRFAVGRALRLYPAYLVAVTLTATCAYFYGSGRTAVTLRQYLANLTMFPEQLHERNVDGVYWTLHVEVHFYIAVFFLILLRLMRKGDVAVLAWILLQASAFILSRLDPRLAHLGSTPYLGGFWSLFGAGCVMALMSRGGATRTHTGLLAITAILAFVEEYRDTVVGRPGTDPWVSASVVLCMFPVFLTFFQTRLGAVRLPYARELGALTYPLYLVHAHIGYMLASRFLDGAHKWLALAVLICISFTLAAAIHRFAEERLHHHWKRFFELTLGRAVRSVQGSGPPAG